MDPGLLEIARAGAAFVQDVTLKTTVLLLRIRLEKSRTELEAVYAEIED